VQALLRDHLRSFEGLEVLMLLQAQASRAWTAIAVSTETRLDVELIREAMSALAGSGLLRQNPSDPLEHRYHPSTPQLASAVEELAAAYREQNATVMSQMSANAIERIRYGTIKAFADAFVLGKRKRDD
jgi:hypothetical protein